jgi:autotransporter-associated beta strand protein
MEVFEMKKFVVMFAIITLVFSPVTPGHAVESVFTGADGEWTTPGSWSNGVPGAGDDAVINASVQTISGGSGTASVLSAVFNNNTLWDSAWNGLTLEVGGGAGMATFNDNSLNRGKINGNATFNDNSFSSWGTINGNATFNDNSRNDVSTINGNATFNGSSYDVQSTINGDMYIKSNWWSGVAGAPTGNELVIAAGREWGSAVTGRVYNSNLIPVEITQYTFNDGRLHRHGTLNGNVVFNLTDPDVGDQAGTINAGDTGTVSGNFRTSSGITFLSGTVSSNINGTGGVTKKGAGTVTMSGTSTYTGLTVLTEGVLSVSMIGDGGVAGNIGQATNAAENLVLRGGTLRYTGATASTDRNFTVDDHRQSTIEVTGAASTLTMSGSSPLTNGSLTKTGAGTLLLSGTHRYTGGTDVTAGTLRLDGSLASQTVVQTAGTLSGSGTTRNLTIANGGTLSPGSGPGTLTTSGDATYAGGGTYTWEINDAGGVKGTNWDLHDITGDLTITADSGTPFTIAITSLNGAVAGEAANFDKYNNLSSANLIGSVNGF